MARRVGGAERVVGRATCPTSDAEATEPRGVGHASGRFCEDRGVSRASKSSAELTALLHAWRGGDAGALPLLMEHAYPELRRIARRHLVRERAGHTLNSGAVLHEAYMRIVEAAGVDWQDRQHFFATMAMTMRRVLVEHARARGRRKRRGVHVSLHEEALRQPEREIDVLDLDEALAKLEAEGHALAAKVVELKFFGGLSIDEAARALAVSPATVVRTWRFARAWLFREIGAAGPR